MSAEVYKRSFAFKKFETCLINIRSAQGFDYINKESVDVVVEIRSSKEPWSFCAIEGVAIQCII